MSYKVKLKVFEGPLDLLLHLIKKNELDIYDIPIATITKQYLYYLNLMRTLNLDIAGEFLVMAATLMQIKSRMLLPKLEDEVEEIEEEEDPRTELIRRLLEYQRFKEVAQKLAEQEILGRDVFTRGSNGEISEEFGKDSSEISLVELIDAFKNILEEEPPEDFLYVAFEKTSINDKIIEIIERMKNEGNIVFQSLFTDSSNKREIIIVFLALLEIVRLSVVKVIQTTPFGNIIISPINLELPEDFDVKVKNNFAD